MELLYVYCFPHTDHSKITLTKMSDCNFEIPFSIPVSDAISKARQAIEKQNGNFTGDENSGEFEVTIFANLIKGNYSVSGQILKLNITHKPFFVPCSTIENILLKEIP